MNQMGVTSILLNEFNTYLNMYKKLLEKLGHQDRILANKWVSKLKDYAVRIVDMKLRNNILSALVMQMQMGALSAPFNATPQFTSLEQIQAMPELTAENVFPDGFKLPQIMQQSPDQGAFLVTQPVPKCGAFCYLAVVSRPRNN